MKKKYMLTDLFFCHCTSTEGTFHCQFGKCARFPIFRFKKIYTKLNLILVNIWNHGENLQDLRGENHCKNVGIGLTLAFYHDFYGLN